MNTYETLLLLHFVSVGLLIGGEGVAMATGIGISRTSDTRVIGTLARLSSTAEYVALIPGAIGTLVFGLWLVDETFYEFGDTWLVVSYVLWAIAMLVGLLVLGPHSRRVARRAEALRSDGVDESEELHAEASKPLIAILGMGQVVIIIAFLYLMTAKPGA